MELSATKTKEARSRALSQWFDSERPAVLVVGYEQYRILVEGGHDRKRESGKKAEGETGLMQREWRYFLQNPGSRS